MNGGGKMENGYTAEMLNLIYESALNQVEEGVVISDDENRVIFINRAAEVIEGLDAKKSLGKSMEELYAPTEHTPHHSHHSVVLDTGIPANEYYNQYVVKESHKVINAIERMFPVNVGKKTIAVYSLLKNLPVIKKSMEQSLELYTHFAEEKPKNGTKYTFSSILGNDLRFVETLSDAKHVAKNQTNVLIYGETGTGKELFAQSIHNYSVYQTGPFISVNCAAIPDTLLESMFFGAVKGAYTGATNTRGLFEQAENGTIFLDEINSMDISLQAKILKVIENKKVRRIGSDKEIDVVCRILCALNEDPVECIEKGKLRRDLYYRLSSCILQIPPLRERKSDIPLFCNYFLQRFNKEYHQNIRWVDDDLLALFLHYQWPGNVRELQHVVESAYSVAEENIDVLRLEHISPYYKSALLKSRRAWQEETADKTEVNQGETGWAGRDIKEDAYREKSQGKESLKEIPYEKSQDTEGLKGLIDEYEKRILKKALEENQRNVTATAMKLKITRQALQHKIKKYHL